MNLQQRFETSSGSVLNSKVRLRDQIVLMKLFCMCSYSKNKEINSMLVSKVGTPGYIGELPFPPLQVCVFVSWSAGRPKSSFNDLRKLNFHNARLIHGVSSTLQASLMTCLMSLPTSKALSEMWHSYPNSAQICKTRATQPSKRLA